MASIKATLATVINPKVAAAVSRPDNTQTWYRNGLRVRRVIKHVFLGHTDKGQTACSSAELQPKLGPVISRDQAPCASARNRLRMRHRIGSGTQQTIAGRIDSSLGRDRVNN
jgi:hypothetical protein